MLSPAEVQQALEQLPSLIAKAAQKVSQSELELRQKRHEAEFTRAKKFLELAAGEKKTVKMLEAEVDTDTEVYEMEADIITKDGELKANQVELDELNNKFIAARKIASLVDTETKSGIR